MLGIDFWTMCERLFIRIRGGAICTYIHMYTHLYMRIYIYMHNGYHVCNVYIHVICVVAGCSVGVDLP